MRYSREHKLETHARIVRKASVRLREKGAHGVGVAGQVRQHVRPGPPGQQRRLPQVRLGDDPGRPEQALRRVVDLVA